MRGPQVNWERAGGLIPRQRESPCLTSHGSLASPPTHILPNRFDAQTGADREVQRILMELLNQMDGFDQTVNVKVREALSLHVSFSQEA